MFGGSYPITIGTSVVGGLGLSGGHWAQDMKIAESALARFNACPRHDDAHIVAAAEEDLADGITGIRRVAGDDSWGSYP